MLAFLQKGPKVPNLGRIARKVPESAEKGRNVESVSKRQIIKAGLKEVSSSWSKLGVLEYIALT